MLDRKQIAEVEVLEAKLKIVEGLLKMALLDSEAYDRGERVEERWQLPAREYFNHIKGEDYGG